MHQVPAGPWMLSRPVCNHSRKPGDYHNWSPRGCLTTLSSHTSGSSYLRIFWAFLRFRIFFLRHFHLWLPRFFQTLEPLFMLHPLCLSLSRVILPHSYGFLLSLAQTDVDDAACQRILLVKNIPAVYDDWRAHQSLHLVQLDLLVHGVVVHYDCCIRA